MPRHLPALAFLLALTLYLLTLPGGLTWAHNGMDGGELVTAAATLGVPHPPGYPTYVLLGKLFSLLPLGTFAWRLNLFSAVAAALAAAVVVKTAAQQAPAAHPAALLAVGLTCAFSRLVWQQAIITEVYALNLLFVALLLWQLSRPSSDRSARRSERSAWRSGLLFGLCITTHLTSLLLLPLLLWQLPTRRWTATFAAAALGLLPLTLLPLLAYGDSPVVWGDLTSWRGWWQHVSGALYRPNLLNANPLSRLRADLPLLIGVLGGVGWPLLLLRGQRQPLPRALLLATAALYALYAYTYDADDYHVVLLPAVLLLALALIPALERLSAAALLLPLLLVGLNFNAVNLHGDQQVRRLATAAWQATPTGALVLTPGDQTIFSLWYYHYVEGERADVTLVDQNLFAFGWYRRRLQQQHPDLLALTHDDLDLFVRANRAAAPHGRPVCRLTLDGPTVSCDTPAAQP